MDFRDVSVPLGLANGSDGKMQALTEASEGEGFWAWGAWALSWDNSPLADGRRWVWRGAKAFSPDGGGVLSKACGGMEPPCAQRWSALE